MRSLTSTLLAAQQAASGVPAFAAELHDRDVGVARLRWERWYTGAEAAGPCVAAVPADGSLLRARIDVGAATLYHSRVASPGSGSTYSGWTSLGTVATAPRLGLAAAGTRALVAYVATGGLAVRIRESTDSGASFGGSTTLVTAGGAVTAIACALQSDGSAAVVYAVAGVVYRLTRTGTGSWSAATAWSNSLATVSGLAALFTTDYQVLVSGTTSAGDAGAWACILGAGGVLPAGNWSGLSEVAGAASGTLVTYLATGLAFADVPRAALVESYSGGGAYSRAQLASGTEASDFDDFPWREPQPFEVASSHGVGIAAGAADGWLVTAAGVWHATSSVTGVILSDDVLEADVQLSAERGRLRLVLRNEDGRYGVAAAPALAPGGELRVAPGFVTSAGVETSEGMRFWITSVARRRARGAATVEVEAVDGWGVLAAWIAPRQLVWAAGAATVHDIVTLMLRRAGLRLSVSPGSNESTAHQPAFTVRAGESAATAVRRLLEVVPDVLRMRGSTPVLFEPLASESSGYACGTTHAVEALSAEEGRQAAGWARVFGAGVFAESVDVAALHAGAGAALVVDDALAAQARADVRATTVLRRQALAVPRGELVSPPNVGAEVWDVIDVTDATLGLSGAKYRVAGWRLRFSRAARPVYEQTLQLVTA
ncbi:MAG: hypothetical protein R3B59_07615 [Dehalococcoidia bacterium]